MFGSSEENSYLCTRKINMVPVVQLVRASDCGSECRRFESVRAPLQNSCESMTCGSFCFMLALLCYLVFKPENVSKTMQIQKIAAK